MLSCRFLCYMVYAFDRFPHIRRVGQRITYEWRCSVLHGAEHTNTCHAKDAPRDYLPVPLQPRPRVYVAPKLNTYARTKEGVAD